MKKLNFCREMGEALISAYLLDRGQFLSYPESELEIKSLSFWGLTLKTNILLENGYKITEHGRLFVEGKIHLHKTAIITGGNVKFSGKIVQINHILGRKFSYLELTNKPEEAKNA